MNLSGKKLGEHMQTMMKLRERLIASGLIKKKAVNPYSFIDDQKTDVTLAKL